MKIKLTNAEYKIMETIWENGDMKAADLRKQMAAENGWPEGSTRAAISNCIKKGYIERIDPGYWCHASVSKEEVGGDEIRGVLRRIFDNSPTKFFAYFADNAELTLEDCREIRKCLELMEQKGMQEKGRNE